MKKCGSCGAEFEDNVKFCTNCGEKLVDEEKTEEVTTEEASEEIPAPEAPSVPVFSNESDIPELPNVSTAVELVKDDFPIIAVTFAFLACFLQGVPGIIFAALSKKKVKEYLNNGGKNEKLAKVVKIFATLALVFSIIILVVASLYGVIFGAILGFSGIEDLTYEAFI